MEPIALDLLFPANRGSTTPFYSQFEKAQVQFEKPEGHFEKDEVQFEITEFQCEKDKTQIEKDKVGFEIPNYLFLPELEM